LVNYDGWYSTATTTSLARIEYTGTCRPTTAVGERLGGLLNLRGVKVEGLTVSITASGEHRVRVLDPSGKELAARRGRNAQVYRFSELAKTGVYILQVLTAEGSIFRTVCNLANGN